MQWEKLSSLVDAMCDREAAELAEEATDWPGLYFRVRAGERVRTVGTVASQLDVAGRMPAVVLDQLRSVVWRNQGHRVYVVECCRHGDKSPLDSVTLYGDPDESEQVGQVAEGGSVAALAAALVATSRAADERAMFVASRNSEMGDKLLTMAQQLAEARAELRMVDVIGELQHEGEMARAIEVFAQHAGPVVGSLLAAKLGQAAPAPQEAEEAPQEAEEAADPWPRVQTLAGELRAVLDAHPGLLGAAGVPSPQAALVLGELEASLRANLAHVPSGNGDTSTRDSIDVG